MLDEQVDFGSDTSTVFIGVRVVGGVDCTLFESLEDVDSVADTALRGLEKSLVVLNVLISLIIGADTFEHFLGNSPRGSSVFRAVDPHTGGDSGHRLVHAYVIAVVYVVSTSCRNVRVDD